MTRSGQDGPLGREEFALALTSLAGTPGPLLLAVSGGPDSTALLHAAARWCADGDTPAPDVATVDHGLRPGSRAEAEAVGAAARGLGLVHHVLPWSRDGAGPVSQEAARRARYGLLADLCRARGFAGFATAHTMDDQAETVLIRLAAGSGPAGLAGMPAASRRRDGLVHHRPFLAIPKSRLVATCRREGWAFVEDPSNADPRHARVRWRGLMPALAKEELTAARLARLADRVRRAERALDAAADAVFARLGGVGPGGVGRWDAHALAAEPEEIALRVLARGVRGPDAAMAPPLERLERCLASLLAALAAGRPHRRTIAGRLLALDAAGRLAIAPEPPRSRGRARPVTLPAAGTPHSLGTGEMHA